MGQAQSSGDGDGQAKKIIEEAKKSIDRLYLSMLNSPTSEDVFMKLPDDMKALFSADHIALRNARAAVVKFRSERERLKAPAVYNMSANLDTMLKNYEFVFMQYMKTMVLAIKLVPALSGGMELYFNNILRRLQDLEKLTEKTRKQMEQDAKMLPDKGKSLQSIKVEFDNLQSVLDGSKKETSKASASVKSASKSLSRSTS